MIKKQSLQPDLQWDVTSIVIPAEKATTLPAMRYYLAKGCEQCSFSDLSACKRTSQPVSSFLLSQSPADHVPSPAVCCTGAAPGHSCLSAVLPTTISSLCPRSPTQLSSRECDFLLSLEVSMALLN